MRITKRQNISNIFRGIAGKPVMKTKGARIWLARKRLAGLDAISLSKLEERLNLLSQSEKKLNKLIDEFDKIKPGMNGGHRQRLLKERNETVKTVKKNFGLYIKSVKALQRALYRKRDMEGAKKTGELIKITENRCEILLSLVR